MNDAWISLLLIAVMGASAWGIGVLLLRRLGVETPARIGFPIVIGVALWCFLGGFLNLFHLALPITQGLLLLLGLVAAVFECARLVRQPAASPKSEKERRASMLLVAGYFVLLLLLSVFQMPSLIVNIGDDFVMYLVRVVRMGATGSVSTDLFDGIGQDSLGAQTFLQGFIAMALPLPYVSGLEHVFSLMLSFLLVREFGVVLQVDRTWTIAASCLLLLIHPQAVNVTSVYSTTAMALGLALALTATTEGKRSQVILPGILLGALVTLKTIGGFQAAFFGLILAGLRFRRAQVSGWLREHLGIAGVSVAVVLPWMIAARDRYRIMFEPVDQVAVYRPPSGVPETSSFFDFIGVDGLLYGGSLLSFDLAVLLLLLFTLLWTLGIRRTESALLLPIAATVMATVATFTLNNSLFNAHTAIRYSVPLILAAAPLAVLGAGVWLARRQRSAAWSVTGLAALVGILFLQPCAQRVQRTIAWQTFVPFPVDDAYAEVCSVSFSPEAQNYIRALQQNVPEGKTILTWIRTPFLLDHGRNRIFTGSTPGMIAPWSRPPLSGNAQDMRRFLRGHGVDYVFYELHDSSQANQILLASGNAIYQKTATYDQAIKAGLENLGKESRLAAAHERFVVFEVRAEEIK